jgi:thioester reductase-like protein
MSNRYIFITGSTGLLGAYLLRDLLLSGRSCAVLVRANRFENCLQRIETILAKFELEDNIILPRPVVLEGDLSQITLGLSHSDRAWIKEHCDTVLHNAASLSFLLDSKTNEPYRSNVNGTENILDFCEEVGIRQFHHVSTAYICGLRTDVCFESELDVGQKFGNDYESSKATAEKIVRKKTFLDSLTIYRPSIIVGDSQTGYTSTYHGYYTPLKIVHSFVNTTDAIDGTPLLGVLGLTGTERKNFVPVDWVASGIVNILNNPTHHNNTFHLTPENPVTCETTLRVFEDALKNFVKNQKRDKQQINPNFSDSNELSLSMFEEIFREQMEIYKAYWRDDPIFDRKNTELAIPDIPCPDMNFETLSRLADFALNNGFGWPRQQPIKPKIWIHDFLNSLDGKINDDLQISTFGLQVNGDGGGSWTLFCDPADKTIRYTRGLPIDDKAVVVYINSNTFNNIAKKQFSFDNALKEGGVHFENSTEEGINSFKNFLQYMTHDA